MEFNPATLFAVLAAAIGGSFHCIGMCGGISLSVTANRPSQFTAYHGSRLFGYLAVGALAGLLGEKFFFAPPLRLLGTLLGWAFAVGLTVAGIRLFHGKKLPYQNPLSLKIANLLFKTSGKTSPVTRAALVGLASVFLPCGWLYTFVLLSLATHSLLGGALTLFVFWLGTLPALAGGQVLIQKLLSRLEVSAQKFTALLMIVTAIASVQMHFRGPADVPNGKASNEVLICH